MASRFPGVSRYGARSSVPGVHCWPIGCHSDVLANAPKQENPPAPIKAKAKSVIQIFLWGGMSHNDTWDPKPEAGRDYMGEFMDRAPHQRAGIQIGGLFPELAKQADKYSLIRSMTHGNNGHETAAYLMQTGHARGERLAYPSVGAVFALFKGRELQGDDPALRRADQGRRGGSPKRASWGRSTSRLPPAAIRTPPVSRSRASSPAASPTTARRPAASCWRRLNTMGRAMATSAELAAAEEAKEAAYELILGTGKEVFDLSKEKPNFAIATAATRSGRIAWWPGGWSRPASRTSSSTTRAAGIRTRTTSRPCGGSARSWTRGWRRCCRTCTTTGCWIARWSGAAASSAADRRSTGSRRGTAAATITARSSPSWSPAADSRAAASSALPTQRAENVKERPVYPVDLLGSIYELAGIDATARLPHPLGLEAHVLPSAADGAKSGRTVRRSCEARTLVPRESVADQQHRTTAPQSIATEHPGLLERLMTSKMAWICTLMSVGCLAGSTTALGQVTPYIGFVYPAGGQQGTTSRVRLGGQRIDGVTGAIVSGAGVSCKLVEYRRKLNPQEITLLREQVRELKRGPKKKAPATLKLIATIEQRISEYVNRPASTALSSIAIVDVTIAPNAAPGSRELRLITPRGVTNPMIFHVDQLPEVNRKPMRTAPLQVLGKEYLALRKRPPDEVEQRVSIPCTMNGQIASGEVNRYRFEATKGQQLVIVVNARQLIPYIADAVPGWFQPVLALYDAAGKEVAFDDDFRFKPDPIVYYKVPKSGEYVLAINDAIYRGARILYTVFDSVNCPLSRPRFLSEARSANRSMSRSAAGT